MIQKKSKGKVQNLKTYANALVNRLPYPYISEIKVCMFNQDNKIKIINGFKSYIKENKAINDSEFCKILNISKDEINLIRKMACETNLDFFIQELLKIDNMKSKIIKYIQIQGIRCYT